jgi:glucose 1-dehydrogenase
LAHHSSQPLAGAGFFTKAKLKIACTMISKARPSARRRAAWIEDNDICDKYCGGSQIVKAVAVFPKHRSVRLIDVAEPHIQSNSQVKLRVLEVGICGTDRELCRFVHGTPPAGQDYFILGHESLAEVVETGSSVTDLSIGDLVVGSVRLPCSQSECDACCFGHQDFCSTGDYLEHGIKGLHGFMAEYVVEERRFLHPVPRHLRDVGVLVEPLTIAEKAMLAVRSTQSRLPWQGRAKTALVIGAGPVGLLGAMKLLSAGYRTFVYSLGLRESLPARIAESIGATFISANETAVDIAAGIVGSIDLVYEAVGAAQVSLDVLYRLAPNGIYVFTGVPRNQTLQAIDSNLLLTNLVTRNQAVIGVVNAGSEAFSLAVRDLSEFYSKWPEAVRGLITHRFPIKQFAQALESSADSIKNVVAIEESSAIG